MGCIYSRDSIIDLAESGSLIWATSLPQLPTTGFITAGYPRFSSAPSADSSVNARNVLGVGTFAWASFMDARSLFPHVVATLCEFTTILPYDSRAAVA